MFIHSGLPWIVTLLCFLDFTSFVSTNHSGSDDPLDWLRDSVPGEPGVDYPIFNDAAGSSFSCQGKVFGGYYADVELECQAYHICVPAQGREGKISFLCPNGTLFYQKKFICDWWFNVDCELAESSFNLNDAIGVSQSGSPDGGFERETNPVKSEPKPAKSKPDSAKNKPDFSKNKPKPAQNRPKVTSETSKSNLGRNIPTSNGGFGNSLTGSEEGKTGRGTSGASGNQSPKNDLGLSIYEQQQLQRSGGFSGHRKSFQSARTQQTKAQNGRRKIQSREGGTVGIARRSGGKRKISRGDGRVSQSHGLSGKISNNDFIEIVEYDVTIPDYDEGSIVFTNDFDITPLLIDLSEIDLEGLAGRSGVNNRFKQIQNGENGKDIKSRSHNTGIMTQNSIIKKYSNGIISHQGQTRDHNGGTKPQSRQTERKGTRIRAQSGGIQTKNGVTIRAQIGGIQTKNGGTITQTGGHRTQKGGVKNQSGGTRIQGSGTNYLKGGKTYKIRETTFQNRGTITEGGRRGTFSSGIQLQKTQPNKGSLGEEELIQDFFDIVQYDATLPSDDEKQEVGNDFEDNPFNVVLPVDIDKFYQTRF